MKKKIILVILAILLLSVVIIATRPTQVSPVPTAGTQFNISQSIEIAINASDDVNISAVVANLTYPNGSVQSITLLNSTQPASNLTQKYNATFTIGTVFGRYNVSFHANDTANNLSNATTYFLVLNGLTVARTVPTNATLTNSANITFGCNGSTSAAYNITNLTVAIYNSTSLYYSNTTNLSNSFNSTNWTVTNITDNTYTWNCLARNPYNSSRTANGTVTSDRTSPSITLALDQATKNTIRVTITPAGSSGLCTANRVGATITSISGSQQSMLEQGLPCGASQSYTITCTDLAGNSGAKTQSFSTLSCSSGSSGGGGGGGSSSTQSNVEWRSSFSITGKIPEDYSRSLSTQERIRFDFEGETHHVGVVDIDPKSITIEVASDPIETELAVGESKKFELNNDEYYDLRVKFVGFVGEEANVSLIEIHEEIPVEERVQETVETPEAIEETIDEETGVIEEEVKDSKTTLIIILIIVVLIIGIGGYLIFRSYKSKEPPRNL